MKFVKMVPYDRRPGLDRALWIDEATGQTIVTSYNPDAFGREECMAFYADAHGQITDFFDIACALEPEAASKVASLREAIYLESRKALWHVAAIRQIEARKAE